MDPKIFLNKTFAFEIYKQIMDDVNEEFVTFALHAVATSTLQVQVLNI